MKIPLSFPDKDRLTKKVGATGSQRGQIKKTTETTTPGCFEVFVHNGMETVMEVKPGQLDYYIGVCDTGTDVALSITIAMIGYNKSYTITKLSIKVKNERIAKMVAEGRVASGLSVEYVERAIPMLISHLE